MLPYMSVEIITEIRLAAALQDKQKQNQDHVLLSLFPKLSFSNQSQSETRRVRVC